jgi:innexin
VSTNINFYGLNSNIYSVGDPINCINDGAIPVHVINTFCWITYTYTLPGQHGKPVGTHVASSGLGNDYNSEKTYHSYYQWVPFTLFFQGIMFYVPHWIWKNWEEGKMRMITEGVRGVLTMPLGERRHRQERLVRYIMDSLRTHNTYAFGYFFCEFLNVCNVVSFNEKSKFVKFFKFNVSPLFADLKYCNGRQIFGG